MTRRRFPRAGGRRGLTVFIVLLVIGMLFAVGAFAARMSNVGVASAGRYKQMAQTHYLSESGVQSALVELGRNPQQRADQLRNEQVPSGVGSYPCKSLPIIGGVPSSPAKNGCIRLGYAWFEERARAETGAGALALLEPRGAPVGGLFPPGSLGAGSVAGNYGVEVTDLGSAPNPPGWSNQRGGTGSLVFKTVSVLSTGQVLPTDAALTAGNFALKYNVSQEETRALVVIGPITGD